VSTPKAPNGANTSDDGRSPGCKHDARGPRTGSIEVFVAEVPWLARGDRISTARARAEDGAAGHLSSPSLTESLVLRAVAAESGCSSDDHGEISAAIGERNVTAAGWTSAHVKKPPPTSSLRQSGSGAQYSRVPSSPVCAPFRSVSSLRRRRAL
jgi:hypothetical protein